MNQRGGKYFLARLDEPPTAEGVIALPEDAACLLEIGARVLLYDERGEGDAAKAAFTGWGDVERVTPGEDAYAVRLRAHTAFRPRIPFADLRSDPRRDRQAQVQPASAEVFNTVLARSRR